MSFSKTIRSAVALADKITADLQVDVVHYAWIGTDSTYGAPEYAVAVTRKALVELKQRVLKTADGQDFVQKASITFLRPITANGAVNRLEPIDLRDKFTLPNGYTGPVKLVEGLANKFADSPYTLEVVLG